LSFVQAAPVISSKLSQEKCDIIKKNKDATFKRLIKTSFIYNPKKDLMFVNYCWLTKFKYSKNFYENFINPPLLEDSISKLMRKIGELVKQQIRF